MSSSNKSVLRSNKVNEVEKLSLPKWDQNGNLVKKPAKRPVKQTVKEVKQEEIKAPTVKELEKIREDAYNEGFEQGYENGMAQGQRSGLESGRAEGVTQGQEEGRLKGLTEGTEQALQEEREKSDQKLQIFTSLSLALKDQVAVEQTELEKALLALSVRIARQVLQDELRTKPGHISNIVHAAVQSLPNPDEKLTLFLNPDEIDFVASFAESHWVLSADETVSLGGCKIKSGFSYIDYTLEHRFDTAVTHLISHIGEDISDVVKEPISEEFLLRDNEAKNSPPNNTQEIDETGSIATDDTDAGTPTVVSAGTTEKELIDDVASENNLAVTAPEKPVLDDLEISSIDEDPEHSLADNFAQGLLPEGEDVETNDEINTSEVTPLSEKPESDSTATDALNTKELNESTDQQTDVQDLEKPVLDSSRLKIDEEVIDSDEPGAVDDQQSTE